MEFNQIDLEYSHALAVTWDLGRRCNLDCSYCPSYRHDNHSPFADLQELKSAGEFVFSYLQLYMKHRRNPKAKIDFTGGEPTINPSFAEFSQWLRATHQERFSDLYGLELCVTSNGIINEKIRQNLVDQYDFATFSYHVESTSAQKNRFIDNMAFFKESGFPFKVNVMFHAKLEHFNECLQLSQRLRNMGVDFVPRLIGEKDNKDRYNHQYQANQLAWMKSFWKNPQGTSFVLPEAVATETSGAAEEKKSACSIGRPCCGNRQMYVGSSNENAEKTTYVPSTSFKDWSCSVNWFFLHIEQQTKEVFHHQTCQARFDYSRGPIGSLDDPEAILAQVRSPMERGEMPVIQCSKPTCACGLCAPKAKSLKDLHRILPKHVDPVVFRRSEVLDFIEGQPHERI